jgi:hypothetical protein
MDPPAGASEPDQLALLCVGEISSCARAVLVKQRNDSADDGPI